jgi:hypothetical protein
MRMMAVIVSVLLCGWWGNILQNSLSLVRGTGFNIDLTRDNMSPFCIDIRIRVTNK